MAMDEVNQPVRQVSRKIRTEVARSILPQPPRHIDTWISFAGELDIRIGFVIPEQDVEGGASIA